MILDITFVRGGLNKVAFAGHVASPSDAVRVMASFAKLPGDIVHAGSHSAAPETRTALWIEDENKRGRAHIGVLECPAPLTEHGGYVGRYVSDILATPSWMAQAFLPEQHLQSDHPRVYLYRPDGTMARSSEHFTLQSAFRAIRFWVYECVMGRDQDLAIDAIDALERDMCGSVSSPVNAPNCPHTIIDPVMAFDSCTYNCSDAGNLRDIGLLKATETDPAQNAQDSAGAEAIDWRLAEDDEGFDYIGSVDSSTGYGIMHWAHGFTIAFWGGVSWSFQNAMGEFAANWMEHDEHKAYSTLDGAKAACLANHVTMSGGVAGE